MRPLPCAWAGRFVLCTEQAVRTMLQRAMDAKACKETQKQFSSQVHGQKVEDATLENALRIAQNALMVGHTCVLDSDRSD